MKAEFLVILLALSLFSAAPVIASGYNGQGQFLASSVDQSNSTSSVTSVSSAQGGASYTVNHESYMSMYIAENVSVGFGNNQSLVSLVTSKSTYSNVSFVSSKLTQSSDVVNVPVQSSFLFLTTVSGGALVSGQVSATVSNDDQISINSPPQLVRVIFVQNRSAQAVWAGYLSAPTNVSGHAYIDPNYNSSIVLQYADGQSLHNVTMNLSPGQTTTSASVSGLVQMSSRSVFSNSTSTDLNLRFPRPYFSASSQFNLTAGLKTSGNFTSNVNITGSRSGPISADIAGATVPAFRWQLEGSISLQNSIGSSQSSSSLISAQFPFKASMLEFFGINSTKLGYQQTLYTNGEFAFSSQYGAAAAHAKVDMLASLDTSVLSNNHQYFASPSAAAQFSVSNSSVLVFFSRNGQFETTANATYYRSVYLNSSGAILRIQINSSSRLVAVFSNNQSGSVGWVSPESVSNDTLTVNGTTHVAQKVVVNGSGYVLFNVTLTSSGNITVYKMTSSGGPVQLESNNYVISNGKLEVFDDPSTTYYVVYPQIVTSSSNNIFGGTGGLLAILVVVIVVIIGIAIFLTRRRKSTPQV